MTITSDRLKPGKKATVSELTGNLSLCGRLCDLGFVPGTEIELIRRAPFGEPFVFAVRGSKVGLGKKEAVAIRLKTI